MIDHRALLPDLQRLVSRLEDDLRQRADEVPELAAWVRAEHARAKQAGRTGDALPTFREGLLTQSAVAWVLAAVFVRFLEDHGFLDDARGARRFVAGHDLDHLAIANETQTLYFRERPGDGEREYLLRVFAEVAALPGMDRLLGRGQSSLWDLTLSADGARDLLEAFRRRDPETGEVVHVFRPRPGDEDAGPAARTDRFDTRFLGDLYQDLSESARKRYALLQTPDFVEEFILDRTLGPAIDEFGYRAVRLLDPACGSGHFLLGAFDRLLALATSHEPAASPRELAQRVLLQVHGVDVNPYAAAIARFRLLVAALVACDVGRLSQAPDFEIRVAAGDSLLHGLRPGGGTGRGTVGAGGTNLGLDFGEGGVHDHFYASEDAELLRTVLGQPFHVVVGNPPYITVKDKGLSKEYRELYASCHRQYSLVCPFLERVFDLAISPALGQTAPAGHVGVIVGNAFMKREFGKKLIQELVPKWDLTHVVDTSGAYIPGHGTPTVILFGRSRAPVADEVRAVLGIRGEPSTPHDAAQGKVWRAIVRQIDRVGSESDFVSVDDVPRERFHEHPWSLGGGGAAELKARLDEGAAQTAAQIVESPIGRAVRMAQEEIFMFPSGRRKHTSAPASEFRELVIGEGVRDWRVEPPLEVWYPYANTADSSPAIRELWRWKPLLRRRPTFQGTMEEAGLRWYEYQQHTASAYSTPLSITFAFVATHNHFVLDRGGKVFNRTAPVIKLPSDASEEEHFGLLGLLNSSIACFWMKSTFFNKGATSHKGILQDDPERFRFEFDGTKLASFPIPDTTRAQHRALFELSSELDRLGRERGEPLGTHVTRLAVEPESLRVELGELLKEREKAHLQMVACQEELDWLCYEIYDLLPTEGAARSLALTGSVSEIPPLHEDARLYRNLEASDETIATWSPLQRARRDAVRETKAIRLCERPEHKRRWFRSAGAYNADNLTDEMELRDALRGWMLDRLEAPDLWPSDGAGPTLQTTSRLADRLRRDPAFLEVARLYTGDPDVELEPLVRKLALDESVPYLPELRYKPSGLRKRAQWEATWELQRREDAIDARTSLPEGHPDHLTPEQAARTKATEVGDIPVAPKYKSSDFASSTVWRLRGKLDVPKERFVHLPDAEREADPTPVLAWAGWDHLQRARALATYYLRVKDEEAWPAERLRPLLQCLRQLLPWLHQWHGDVDPGIGMSMAEYFEGFVAEEERGTTTSPE